MATLPVEIIDLRGQRESALHAAVKEANRIQGEISFTFLDSSYIDAMQLSVFSDTHCEHFFDTLSQRKLEWRGFHPFIVSFIDSPLHSDHLSNLFAMRRPEEGFSIITSSMVENLIIPKGKMAAYYLYELASQVLALISSGREFHKENRGCVFDLKIDKHDILTSMRGGALCDECRAWFLKNGEELSPSQLASVNRLLERCSELLKQEPRTKSAETVNPRVFVGSSVEGLDVARAVQSDLQYDYSVEIWNQNTVFGLGTATIEALEEAVNIYDYGVFVFTPDDKIEGKSGTTMVPRDNVILEAGLFIGKLSRHRTFIVSPRAIEIQLPSDLHGLTIASYDPNSPNIDAAIGPACRAIRTAIKKDG